MKWTTKTTYVDSETGEQLTAKHIELGHYIKMKHTQKLQRHGNDYGTRYITWQCQRNTQTKLF